ncbi:reverse transcriptase domain-containing protein [Tanacetum coccineum]
MMSQTRNTRGRENSTQPHLVFTNNDLLTEILIRLPILYIHLFTTVSKQWLRILTSPYFTLSRNKIPNLDSPAGIFANHLRSLFECDFVSLDSRLNSKKFTMDNSFGSAEEVDHVRILQSCNGLLLCTEIPHGLHMGRNFLECFGGSSDDPILLLLEIPHMLHLEGKFFESNWLYRDGRFGQVFDISLREGEEDTLLMINLSGNVVKYNLISKTINEIFDIGSNQMDDDDVEFIPHFSVDANLYEFIPSLASV